MSKHAVKISSFSTTIQDINRNVDSRYTGSRKSKNLKDKAYDWFNYPLTGKAPM
jgi:hypothetical protein